MPLDGEQAKSFSDKFDDELPVGPEESTSALFGRNVFRGLIESLDDFINVRRPRWRQFRSMGVQPF